MREPLWRQNFYDLGEALDRLEESLKVPVDEYRVIMDGTIQRFEFCIELFWKNFKNLAELEGEEVLSPKQAISQAYQFRWFNDERMWLDMLRDHNLTSHTYKKILADEIYQRIKTYYPEMRDTYNRLKEIFSL
jgi:nucleotidyltransferase substrate binding protein (TIGR01987 family)